MTDTPAPTPSPPSTSSDQIEWSDPPPFSRGRAIVGIWYERLAPFVDKPGEWGVLATFDTGFEGERFASNAQRTPNKQPGTWEFTSRSFPPSDEHPDGWSRVWAQYVSGDPQPPRRRGRPSGSNSNYVTVKSDGFVPAPDPSIKLDPDWRNQPMGSSKQPPAETIQVETIRADVVMPGPVPFPAPPTVPYPQPVQAPVPEQPAPEPVIVPPAGSVEGPIEALKMMEEAGLVEGLEMPIPWSETLAQIQAASPDPDPLVPGYMGDDPDSDELSEF